MPDGGGDTIKLQMSSTSLGHLDVGGPTFDVALVSRF
jgi:hypothetical protein